MIKEILLREPAVLCATGLKRSTFRKRIADGLWTRPVKVGVRAAAWPSGECAALNAARIAGLHEDEIRALVHELEAKRVTALADVLAAIGPGPHAE